jgi:prephenate dehydrogenase
MSIKRITIIGLGNIGSSVALAVSNNDAADVEVSGYARNEETGREAVRLGVVQRFCDNLAEAVSGADLVVLATPVTAMEDLMRQINPHLAPGAVVTDVGSTKVDVNNWGENTIGPEATFVGGHPMAGSAAAGIAGANGEMFKDTVFCVVPGRDTPAAACAVVEQLVEWIGARPIRMTAQQHDHCVASVSHLPMLLASILVTSAAGHEDWDVMSQLAALGFREMTRMAAGSAEVRRSICSTNKQAIADSIDGFIGTLQDYRQHILQDDEELLVLFDEAREDRRNWVETRYPRKRND